jgi:pilus assembly protein CpaB
MNGTGRKLLIISFILALLSAAVVFVYLQSLNKKEEPVRQVTVLVAAETIPARTKIEKKMIKEIQVPESDLTNNCIKSSSELIGKYTKETIFANESFLSGKVSGAKDSDLGFKVDENHRAVSVIATGESGVAFLIKPGDFVDVIVFLPEKKDGQKIVRPDTAKLILQNIKVLAIDTQLVREEESPKKEEEKLPTSYFVTLSVPIADVEKLVLAEDIGSLKLALRPLGNDKTQDTDGTVWQDLLSKSGSSGSGSNSQSQSKYTKYKVKLGDTLCSISRAFYGIPDYYPLLKRINSIKDENNITPGTIIKIPILK